MPTPPPLPPFGGIAPGMSLLLKFRAPEMQALLDSVLLGHRRLGCRRLCRARAGRAGLPGQRVLGRPRHRSVRAGLQGPERDAPHRPHARRLHRQCQPRTAHAAGLDRRLHRDAARPGPQRCRGARAVPADHAEPDRPHGAADRRSAVAVAAGDEALSDAGHRGRSAPDHRQRHRFAQARWPGKTASSSRSDFARGPLDVPGDRDELFQVFENLLENACKYGQSGGRVDRVDRATAMPVPNPRSTSRSGISARALPKSTFRASPSASTASMSRPAAPQKGTGLGLSIVKHILTRHNARLSIKSEVGQGRGFTVHLPAR